MIVYKISLNGHAGLAVKQNEIQTIVHELENLDPENVLTIEVVEMSEERYDRLAEFQGW